VPRRARVGTHGGERGQPRRAPQPGRAPSVGDHVAPTRRGRVAVVPRAAGGAGGRVVVGEEPYTACDGVDATQRAVETCRAQGALGETGARDDAVHGARHVGVAAGGARLVTRRPLPTETTHGARLTLRDAGQIGEPRPGAARAGPLRGKRCARWAVVAGRTRAHGIGRGARAVEPALAVGATGASGALGCSGQVGEGGKRAGGAVVLRTHNDEGVGVGEVGGVVVAD